MNGHDVPGSLPACRKPAMNRLPAARSSGPSTHVTWGTTLRPDQGVDLIERLDIYCRIGTDRFRTCLHQRLFGAVSHPQKTARAAGIRKAMQRQFEDLLLGSIELFCLAAELESFTVAATAAGVTPAAVSRSVARLEARLGVRLFVRTTRQIRLTDAGRRYFEQCRLALNQLADAEREATGQQTSPAGSLRISMPTPYGHYRVLPLLAEFRQRYPGVTVETHLSNRNIDFADEGFDLAIRGRAPDDSGLIARKLEDAELVVIASPAYLSRAGEPKTPDDLVNHDCIQFELPSNGRNIPWPFMRDGESVEMITRGGYGSSGDVLAGATLARNGAGVFQTYRFIVEKDLAEGTLKELLVPYGGCSRPFVLLYPHSRHLSSRVRSFVDFLVEKLGERRAANVPKGRKRAQSPA